MKKFLVNEDPYKPDQVLAGWVEAVTRFYHYHNQVANCINQRVIEQNLGIRNNTYIGQCPVNALKDLLTVTQEQLVTLLQEIDPLASHSPSTGRQNYKKLETHTHVLTGLSLKAQNALYLCSLPSLKIEKG